jgi:hypothetical protein
VIAIDSLIGESLFESKQMIAVVVDVIEAQIK